MSKVHLKRSPELKHVSLASANYALDTTGSVTLLNSVAAGTDDTNRIGRHFRMRRIRINGYTVASQSPAGATLSRIMLVYDKQSNGALPTIAQILEASTSVSNLNTDYLDRFVILKDWRQAEAKFDQTATTSVSGSPQNHEFIFDQVASLDVEYSSAAAGIANIVTGSLLLVTVGSNAAGNGRSLTAATQVLFDDM
jgi:hypothetical protein